jgi:hypothetical protein
LKYVRDTYELIRKEDLITQTFTAKNDRDAEIQSRLLIKNAETKDKSSIVEKGH